MTGLARDDHGLEHGRHAERLYKALSHFLIASLLVGPILLGIWVASSAIEDVKPLEPLPAPKIAPLPQIQSESELPAPDAAKVNLVAGTVTRPQLR
jgi:hypothetical protein